MSSCRQTILEIMHTAVTACLGIALTTRSRRRRDKVGIAVYGYEILFTVAVVCTPDPVALWSKPRLARRRR